LLRFGTAAPHTPGAVHGVHRAAPLRGAPENRLIGDAVIGVSDRLPRLRRSALTALTPSQTLGSIERKRIHWPSWATRTETEKSGRDRPVSFAPKTAIGGAPRYRPVRHLGRS
jgi:hypothetical protein